MPDLELRKQPLTDGIVLVEAKGFLDAHTFEQLEKLINDLFARDYYKLIVKMDQLEYISSAGAGVFVGAIGQAQEHGGNIVFLNPNPNVKEVFDLLGLSQIFPYASDQASAMEIFQ